MFWISLLRFNLSLPCVYLNKNKTNKKNKKRKICTQRLKESTVEGTFVWGTFYKNCPRLFWTKHSVCTSNAKAMTVFAVAFPRFKNRNQSLQSLKYSKKRQAERERACTESIILRIWTIYFLFREHLLSVNPTGAPGKEHIALRWLYKRLLCAQVAFFFFILFFFFNSSIVFSLLF